ncbi:hypothetical protein A4D02_35815 [Niastella koreensis]|uniref:TIR domain-containing protein n=2 Tax=Niastella koreensis TaxID=354356 RepID=G8T8S7_NIAKG|nr:hypothetical protein Niako_5018 [Niastella koreensis GR20-10]OQP43435.1 hypothetical protein A4D02_35815 [Niastella koreensis]
MSNYLYYRHIEQELNNRFDTEAVSEGYVIRGARVWRQLISRLLNLLFTEQPQRSGIEQEIRQQTIREFLEVVNRDNSYLYNRVNLAIEGMSTEELIVNLLLFLLRNLFTPRLANDCPRLFISHRQGDQDYALRIAQLAHKKKFAYWVDVLDPDLKILEGSNIPERLLPLVTACIIEMALINCTHVIACMTTKTRGSLWLPYEYGRITELPGNSNKAAAWLHPNLAPKDFPEYMLLGESFRHESEIESWLEEEWRLLGKNDCNPMGGDVLGAVNINELPTVADDELEQSKHEFGEWLKAGLPLLKSLTLSNSRIKFKGDRSS